MNCLSLHQYWAALMDIGAKLIETRHWPTNYRGPLAIHAAQSFQAYARDDYDKQPAVQQALHDSFGVKNAYELHYKLPRGGIGCVVNLDDCVQVPTLPICTLDELVPAQYKTENWQAFGNFSPGRWLWLCSNVRRLREPLKTRGRQNIWTLAPDIAEQVNRRI